VFVGLKPQVNKNNVRKAVRHPKLALKSLGRFNEFELSKEHVQLHLNGLNDVGLDAENLKPIDKVCLAIDTLSKSCYHTEFLYLVCKMFKPQIFVETGVHYGASSAFILKALENTKSILYSIDLPDTQYTKDTGGVHHDSLPGSLKPGFVVPTELRNNWKLILGDSKVELPKLLNSLDQIDIFNHDSNHTYEFMTFEFETVLPKLRPGGLLLSDDADWNDAFEDFCKKYSLEHLIYHGTGIAVKKP